MFSKKDQIRWSKRIFLIHIIVIGLVLLIAAVINVWAFPVQNGWIIPGVIILLAIVFYFLKSKAYCIIQKAVLVPVAAMAFLFFLLNTNFYPQLLTYQGGNQLAFLTKGKINPSEVYFWKDMYSSSFNFYTATLRQPFADSVLQPGKKNWILFDSRNEPEIIKAGYKLDQRYAVPDYEITKLDIKFVNPAKRDQQCSQMVLAVITKDFY